MKIDLLLLILLLLASLWTVMTTRLLRAVIGLAITSVILSIIMFRYSAPLAGVFELSVCAGLISVIFITTISFTQRVDAARYKIRLREHLSKFWALPLILLAVAVYMLNLQIPHNFLPNISANTQDVNMVLWNFRHLDILGQIIVLVVGVFGVVLFFKKVDEK